MTATAHPAVDAFLCDLDARIASGRRDSVLDWNAPARVKIGKEGIRCAVGSTTSIRDSIARRLCLGHRLTDANQRHPLAPALRGEGWGEGISSLHFAAGNRPLQRHHRFHSRGRVLLDCIAAARRAARIKDRREASVPRKRRSSHRQ